MSEVTQKTIRNKKGTWNPLVLDRLNEKFGLSKIYIRQCLRGDRNNETADLIKKEYKRLCDEVNEALKK